MVYFKIVQSHLSTMQPKRLRNTYFWYRVEPGSPLIAVLGVIMENSPIPQPSTSNTLEEVNYGDVLTAPSQEELLCYMGLLFLQNKRKKERQRKRDTMIQRLREKERERQEDLKAELALVAKDYRIHFRMPDELFVELLELITPDIRKKDTFFRTAISPCERLSATLRFLALGGTLKTLHNATDISRQALGPIIIETCKAIYEKLKDDYMKFPQYEHEMRHIANEFKLKWQFPNCLGVVDGRHISIVHPAGVGNDFRNHKGFHSLVLIVIVNANFEFIYVDVGTPGRIADGAAIRETDFYRRLDSGTLVKPLPEKPCENADFLPFVYIGNESFVLRPDFLTPYPHGYLTHSQRIFNYRLGRAHRIVDNTLGIFADRFRLFHSPINMKIESIQIVVKACCAFHNFLRRRTPATYTMPADFDNENYTTGDIAFGLRADEKLAPLLRSPVLNYSSYEAETVRVKFEDHFNTSGAVPWLM